MDKTKFLLPERNAFIILFVGFMLSILTGYLALPFSSINPNPYFALLLIIGIRHGARGVFFGCFLALFFLWISEKSFNNTYSIQDLPWASFLLTSTIIAVLFQENLFLINDLKKKNELQEEKITKSETSLKEAQDQIKAGTLELALNENSFENASRIFTNLINLELNNLHQGAIKELSSFFYSNLIMLNEDDGIKIFYQNQIKQVSDPEINKKFNKEINLMMEVSSKNLMLSVINPADRKALDDTHLVHIVSIKGQGHNNSVTIGLGEIPFQKIMPLSLVHIQKFGAMYLTVKNQLLAKDKNALELPYNSKYKIFNISFLENQYQLECARIARHQYLSTIFRIQIKPISKYFKGSKEDLLLIVSDCIQSFRSSDIAGIIPHTEEFYLIAPTTGKEGAIIVTKKIEAIISKLIDPNKIPEKIISSIILDPENVKNTGSLTEVFEK